FVLPEDVVAVARAMVCVFRDHGNRGDRKTARLKYLLGDWGIQRFKATVEEYLGRSLDDPHPAEVTDVEDHLGWHAQGDGRDFLGIHIENGRIQDTDTVRSKSALRRIVETYRTPTRMTAQQNILLCDIEPSRRVEIDAILSDHGLVAAEQLSTVRRHSMACPALPTCGLSITESERVMPQIIDQLEAELLKQGIPDERIAVRMTGCPNGCARPYSPDIGLVGKTVGKYTVFLGGNAQGTRLAFNFQDVVPLEEIVPRISPVLAFFREDRVDGESFGDFCDRKGREELVVRIDSDGAKE
ncbi:MAG: NADPH-dependent assimilatory sulfite reductase hemoprotein subunit, partial [Planctomycetaceae bacterium]